MEQQTITNPWTCPRPPMAEDERVYRDEKHQPGKVFGPLRFREQSGMGRDSIVALYQQHIEQHMPKRTPGGYGQTNGNAQSVIRVDPNAAGSPVGSSIPKSPSFEDVPGTPQQPTARSAFEDLPAEAQAAIKAQTARAAGAGPVHACPDGTVEEVTSQFLANAAMLEKMCVRRQGAPEPNVDYWLGWRVVAPLAFDAMVIVCNCLQSGQPLPPEGEELTWPLVLANMEADAGRPPEPGSESAPTNSPPESPATSPTQSTPDNSTLIGCSTSPEQSDPALGRSEPLLYGYTPPTVP